MAPSKRRNAMSAIKIFEDKKIRALWLDEEEDWCFSVVDVIEALTDSVQPRKYWNDLKKKIKNEGSELSEKIGQLKMKAKDGKSRLTDVVRTADLLRLVQSIPSPKAEPFKMWLAEDSGLPFALVLYKKGEYEKVE